MTFRIPQRKLAAAAAEVRGTAGQDVVAAKIGQRPDLLLHLGFDFSCQAAVGQAPDKNLPISAARSKSGAVRGKGQAADRHGMAGQEVHLLSAVDVPQPEQATTPRGLALLQIFFHISRGSRVVSLLASLSATNCSLTGSQVNSRRSR